jgi:hypothetical protein
MKVFVVGAGSTFSDALSLPPRRRPPLDKGFFSNAARISPSTIAPIGKYFMKYYGKDITNEKHDSLETVMVQLYADTFHPNLATNAYKLFRTLVRIFSNRLLETTNLMKVRKASNLYAILAAELNGGTDPSDISIITLNQDLHVEKTLFALSSDKDFEETQGIFNFPSHYHLDLASISVTVPTSSVAPKDLFPMGNGDASSVSVLKLHGSVNWYSVHNSRFVSATALFNPKRKLRITRRIAVPPSMTFTRKRTEYAFPVVVPPVPHKSGILHYALKPVWTTAEKHLQSAEKIVVFGYSCPAFDTEASNLLSRSLRLSSIRTLNLITPNATMVSRYQEVADFDEVHYFKSARAYLENVS